MRPVAARHTADGRSGTPPVAAPGEAGHSTAPIVHGVEKGTGEVDVWRGREGVSDGLLAVARASPAIVTGRFGER